jgi:enediyne biosynthesis protein E5
MAEKTPTTPRAEIQPTPPRAAKKPAPPRHDPRVITALRRFAISITFFNFVGYWLLGFEQPWLWPFIALATGYTVELVLELVGAAAERRTPRFRGGGPRGVMEFLLPAHITSLAVNMLTYVNDRVLMMMFGVSVAVGAKWVLRAPVKGRLRHFMNPSNFGIATILVIYPWASIAPPYHFTERVTGPIDWIIPGLIIVGGTMINAKLTNRMWVIFGWVSIFIVQAVVRGLLFGTAIPGALAVITSVAFVLFTNYMITDPGTSPSRPVSQFAFGGGVAVAYGVLTAAHIAYGIFFGTAAVCAIRGAFLWWLHAARKRSGRLAPVAPPAPVPAPAAAEVPATGSESEVAAA